jgi:hypothetical protein
MRLLGFLVGVVISIVSVSWGAEPVRVAVIDTGLNLKDSRFTHLCKDGHYDLSDTSIEDTEGHGTHIASLIQKYAGDSN